MAKLKQDEIKTVYMLEASDAQQKLHALKKSNKELSAVMDKRRKEMVKLEVQGKKNSTAYKNLAAANREDSKTISENTSLIRQQEQAMGISSLTMNQLKSRAKSLRAELNNISKELQPDRWARVNKQLSETTSRMIQLKTSASTLSKNLGGSFLSKQTIASFLGNLYANVATNISRSVAKVKQFISESAELAAKAQGIDHAFNRIADKDYLKKLRRQTKGLISDFTLMQSTVRAENFGIPLSQLGTLLEFAQNRARDTGESVDYLVESIVNGIGRKSPLILDNLGISTARLQQEVKKTGDFASAVGKIIEEEMAKAGPVIDTAADAATRKKVAWENLKLATGKYFVGFKKGWGEISSRFAEGITNIISGQQKATEQFNLQIDKVATLENTMPELINRYEELKNKVSLNVNEQKELNKIIAQITSAVPGAALEWDKYGKIISINTQKVWDFIKAEKAKLAVMNQDAITEQTKKLEKYREEYDHVLNMLKKGEKMVSIQTSSLGTSKHVYVPLTDDEISQYSKRAEELGEKVLGTETYLNELTGKSIEERLQKRSRELQKEAQFNKMEKAQLRAWIKNNKDAANEYVKIAQKAYNSRFGNMEGEEPSGKGKSKESERLKKIEEQFKSEQLLLKDKYAQGLLSQKEFEKQSEELQLAALNKKLEVVGLEKSQRLQIEEQILNFKVKAVELEKQFEKEREALAKSWRSRFLADNEKELEALNEKYDKELEDLKKSLEKKAITEVEFLEYKQQLLDEKEKELSEKKKKQKEAQADKELAELMARKELEKMALQQAYASGLITKEEYQNALLELDKRYSMQALSLENLSAQSKIKIQQEMLDASTKIMEEETAKQKAEQDKRAKLYFQFSEQIGTMLGGFISGNEDMVKSSLKAILNMALDALEAQVTMSIASATAQSFAQSDSVATFGATGLTRAAILTGLIKAAFAGVKAMVNSALSGGASSPDTSGSTTTTSRVVSGRESGGFIDVTREQDGKNYRALLQPKKRGFINRPTVIVGDGPAGESMEWVAGNDALKNPTILPVIRLMNEAQQAGTIRTIDLNHIMRARMAGFASGGFISNNIPPDSGSGSNMANLQSAYNLEYSNMEQVLNELKALLSYLKKYGIKSSVNYHEFKKADENIESIKKKARRN